MATYSDEHGSSLQGFWHCWAQFHVSDPSLFWFWPMMYHWIKKHCLKYYYKMCACCVSLSSGTSSCFIVRRGTGVPYFLIFIFMSSRNVKSLYCTLFPNKRFWDGRLNFNYVNLPMTLVYFLRIKIKSLLFWRLLSYSLMPQGYQSITLKVKWWQYTA